MRFTVKKKPAVSMKELVAEAIEAKKHEVAGVLATFAKVEEAKAQKKAQTILHETANSDYVAVFRVHSHYGLAARGRTLYGGMYFEAKKEALLAARAFQIEKGRDPNFILDLTNVDPAELGEFLR